MILNTYFKMVVVRVKNMEKGIIGTDKVNVYILCLIEFRFVPKPSNTFGFSFYDVEKQGCFKTRK